MNEWLFTIIGYAALAAQNFLADQERGIAPLAVQKEKRSVKGGITNADLNVTSAIPTVVKSAARLILYNPECKDTAPCKEKNDQKVANEQATKWYHEQCDKEKRNKRRRERYTEIKDKINEKRRNDYDNQKEARSAANREYYKRKKAKAKCPGTGLNCFRGIVAN